MATEYRIENVKGQHFRCDLAAPHPLLAHASLEAQALWVSSDEHDEIDTEGMPDPDDVMQDQP